MHSFVLIARKAGGTVAPHVHEFLSRADTPELHFEPESHIRWSDTAGAVHFAGWQAGTDLFEMGSHWKVDDFGLTAFAGRPLPSEGSWGTDDSWAAQLASRFRRRPLAQSLEDLRGGWSAVSVGSDGRGCITSDPLGFEILYLAETSDFTAISNRAPLAARLITQAGHDPLRDPLGVGWLVHSGYLIGDATGFEGVRAIAAGRWVQLDPATGATVRTWSEDPWFFGDTGHTDDVDELIVLVRDDIASALKAMVDLPASQHVADITGGKDSRLILALLIAEGLADRLQFQTGGAPSAPDVMIATDIANRFRLKHNAFPLGRSSSFDAEERLRTHVFRVAGMLGAWDLLSPMPSLRRVHISGGSGEILRTNYSGYPLELSSADEVLRVFQTAMQFDSLGLLNRDVREHFDREAAASLLASQDRVREPLDLIDVFYLRNRWRRWLGTGQDTDFQNRLFPLHSLVGVRTGFAIGARRRRNDFIPFEVIRRCSPALAKVPLAGAPWADELLQDLPDAEEFRTAMPAPLPADTEPQQRPQRSWQAELLEDNVEIFRKFLVADPDHPLYRLINRDAAVAAVDGTRDLTLMQRIQLFGAVTAAIWLGGEELSWRDPLRSKAGPG